MARDNVVEGTEIASMLDVIGDKQTVLISQVIPNTPSRTNGLGGSASRSAMSCHQCSESSRNRVLIRQRRCRGMT
jgi:hypothetical protein